MFHREKNCLKGPPFSQSHAAVWAASRAPDQEGAGSASRPVAVGCWPDVGGPQGDGPCGDPRDGGPGRGWTEPLRAVWGLSTFCWKAFHQEPPSVPGEGKCVPGRPSPCGSPERRAPDLGSPEGLKVEWGGGMFETAGSFFRASPRQLQQKKKKNKKPKPSMVTRPLLRHGLPVWWRWSFEC